ncbi:MAG: HAD family hydrolase [Candidatus Nanohalobium sp.]
MKDIEVLSGKKDFKAFEGKKVVLMDVEGTLKPGDRHVPPNPRPEHVYRMFEGESFEIKTDLGYWSGLHLLAGETPEEYFRRVDKWWNGQISREEFEQENVQQLNKLLEETDHETAEDLVEWYNKSFLNLRDRSAELVKAFKESGFKVGILSHTSESMSCKAARNLDADFVVPSWTFKFSDGRFKFIEKDVYADDKSKAFNEMKEAGVRKIVFVGNGANDVDIAEKAENSFMVENHEQVEYNNVDAETGEFKDILEIVKKRYGGQE